MTLEAVIENFKSIEHLEFEVKPLTLLIGPPASGKSNILDAIAFIGYFNRLNLLHEEYDGRMDYIEDLSLITRFSESPTQLFRNYDLTKAVKVGIYLGGKKLELTMKYEGGRQVVTLNDIVIPWNLTERYMPQSQQGQIENLVRAVRNAMSDMAFEARLYGYDRYSLATPSCKSPYLCGFSWRLKMREHIPYPKGVLSEFGRNACLFTKAVADIIRSINKALEGLEMKVELKVLRDNTILFFDYDVEVEPISSVSDSLLRILYYLMALRTSMNYVKVHGIERRFIVLLEEPESHVFPYFIDLLHDQIVKALNYVYVMIATHNPIFISRLLDKVRDANVYYVYRDTMGTTRIAKVDVDKMAKRLIETQDLFLMTPSEVLSEVCEVQN